MNPTELMNSLLERNLIVPIVVLPCMCQGLHGFPPVQPLKLNLGHTLKPDMLIHVDEKGLDFFASFSGERRKVTVPWEALLFAGRPEDLEKLLAQQPPPSPVVERNENVVHVDFSRKRT